MGVADRDGAVAVVEVDVLVAVDVGDLRSVALDEVDRMRVGGLPARDHPAGQRTPGALGHGARLRVPRVELRLLGLDQARKPGRVDRRGGGLTVKEVAGCAHDCTLPRTSPYRLSRQASAALRPLCWTICINSRCSGVSAAFSMDDRSRFMLTASRSP